MEQIEVHGLTKDYGKGKGVFELDFSIKKGEVFGFWVLMEPERPQPFVS